MREIPALLKNLTNSWNYYDPLTLQRILDQYRVDESGLPLLKNRLKDHLSECESGLFLYDRAGLGMHMLGLHMLDKWFDILENYEKVLWLPYSQVQNLKNEPPLKGSKSVLLVITGIDYKDYEIKFVKYKSHLILEKVDDPLKYSLKNSENCSIYLGRTNDKGFYALVYNDNSEPKKLDLTSYKELFSLVKWPNPNQKKNEISIERQLPEDGYKKIMELAGIPRYEILHKKRNSLNRNNWIPDIINNFSWLAIGNFLPPEFGEPQLLHITLPPLYLNLNYQIIHSDNFKKVVFPCDLLVKKITRYTQEAFQFNREDPNGVFMFKKQHINSFVKGETHLLEKVKEEVIHNHPVISTEEFIRQLSTKTTAKINENSPALDTIPKWYYASLSARATRRIKGKKFFLYGVSGRTIVRRTENDYLSSIGRLEGEEVNIVENSSDEVKEILGILTEKISKEKNYKISENDLKKAKGDWEKRSGGVRKLNKESDNIFKKICSCIRADISDLYISDTMNFFSNACLIAKVGAISEKERERGLYLYRSGDPQEIYVLVVYNKNRREPPFPLRGAIDDRTLKLNWPKEEDIKIKISEDLVNLIASNYELTLSETLDSPYTKIQEQVNKACGSEEIVSTKVSEVLSGKEIGADFQCIILMLVANIIAESARNEEVFFSVFAMLSVISAERLSVGSLSWKQFLASLEAYSSENLVNKEIWIKGVMLDCLNSLGGIHPMTHTNSFDQVQINSNNFWKGEKSEYGISWPELKTQLLYSHWFSSSVFNYPITIKYIKHEFSFPTPKAYNEYEFFFSTAKAYKKFCFDDDLFFTKDFELLARMEIAYDVKFQEQPSLAMLAMLCEKPFQRALSSYLIASRDRVEISPCHENLQFGYNLIIGSDLSRIHLDPLSAYQIATMLEGNSDYDAAIKLYNYLCDRHPKNFEFRRARALMLVLYEALVSDEQLMGFLESDISYMMTDDLYSLEGVKERIDFINCIAALRKEYESFEKLIYGNNKLLFNEIFSKVYSVEKCLDHLSRLCIYFSSYDEEYPGLKRIASLHYINLATYFKEIIYKSKINNQFSLSDICNCLDFIFEFNQNYLFFLSQFAITFFRTDRIYGKILEHIDFKEKIPSKLNKIIPVVKKKDRIRVVEKLHPLAKDVFLLNEILPACIKTFDPKYIYNWKLARDCQNNFVLFEIDFFLAIIIFAWLDHLRARVLMDADNSSGNVVTLLVKPLSSYSRGDYQPTPHPESFVYKKRVFLLNSNNQSLSLLFSEKFCELKRRISEWNLRREGKGISYYLFSSELELPSFFFVKKSISRNEPLIEEILIKLPNSTPVFIVFDWLKENNFAFHWVNDEEKGRCICLTEINLTKEDTLFNSETSNGESIKNHISNEYKDNFKNSNTPSELSGNEIDGVSIEAKEKTRAGDDSNNNPSYTFQNKNDQICKRKIDNFELQDVDDNGNCFYLASIDQMREMNHPFLNSVPQGTEDHDSLRLLIQGRDFKDGEWADIPEIKKLVTNRELKLNVAIIDTRKPHIGFRIYFFNTQEDRFDESYEPIMDRTDHVTIQLAFTGNHYLSVRSHPALERGAVRDGLNLYHSTNSNSQSALVPLTFIESASQNRARINQSREKLHNEPEVNEKLSLLISKNYVLGDAISKGDCFYDALALALNQKLNVEEYSAESIRLLCFDYLQGEEKSQWVKNAVRQDGGDYADFNVYKDRVRYTEANWPAEFGDALPVWGRPEIEGRMICSVLGIQIHVVEVREESTEGVSVTEVIVDADGSKAIEQMPVEEYRREGLIHLVNHHNHFVPLLRNQNTPSLPIAPSLWSSPSQNEGSFGNQSTEGQRNHAAP